MARKIWIDITNTPQVHLLCAIAANINLSVNEFEYSIRDFSETKKLMEKKGIDDYIVFGTHHGKAKVLKALGLISRFTEIYRSNIRFDISISCGSDGAIWTSWLKGRKSIAFGDNDLAKQWTYARFVSFAFFPDAISKEVLFKQGLNAKKLFQYPGFKEDIYLADYKPDTAFLKELPFNSYVIVRAENSQANYINEKTVSITPALLKLLDSKGINVLFLPRYLSDKDYCIGLKHVFMPENAVNGLDAVYYSNAVFTGAGTLAREAACLGIPSFSFFAGKDLLAVDKKLITERKMFFSRDPQELLLQFTKSRKAKANLKRAVEVRDIVISRLNEVMQGF